jgi:F-type H+-transporting ATPase subunit delta
MAELATLARPYAEALFKSGQSHGSDASAWLGQLAAIAGNPQLLQFADNPKVTSAQVFDLISGVVKGDLPEAGKNFLRTVIDNGRLGVLPEIAHQYRALRNAVGGSADAVVYSAFPIDADALAELGVTLERRFGRKLNLAVELEPALIGGIRVVVGDEVLDTSVSARLQQMRAALTA